MTRVAALLSNNGLFVAVLALLAWAVVGAARDLVVATYVTDAGTMLVFRDEPSAECRYYLDAVRDGAEVRMTDPWGVKWQIVSVACGTDSSKGEAR